jgi:hypothetical protein
LCRHGIPFSPVPFEVLAQGIHAVFPEQCAELHISAAVGGKICTIGIAQRADYSVAVFVVDFTVGITPTAVEV